MQWDLSALLFVHPLLCEIWHGRNYRGFKPKFVTLLTQERNMDFDFRLWRKTQQKRCLCNTAWALAWMIECIGFTANLKFQQHIYYNFSGAFQWSQNKKENSSIDLLWKHSISLSCHKAKWDCHAFFDYKAGLVSILIPWQYQCIST